MARVGAHGEKAEYAAHGGQSFKSSDSSHFPGAGDGLACVERPSPASLCPTLSPAPTLSPRFPPAGLPSVQTNASGGHSGGAKTP